MDGEERVVHRLERVAGADSTTVYDLLTKGQEHGAYTVEHRLVSSDHDGECALLRPTHTAAHGRVDEIDVTLAQTHRNLTRCRRLARGAVHQRGTGAHSREQACITAKKSEDVG